MVLVRRWVHHAQLELVPVLVPPGSNVAALLHPPVPALLARMARDVSESLSPPQRRRLAVLTFDDGPYPVTTPALIARLRSLGVPADFFLIGDDVITQPAIAMQAAAAGIELGNHTLTHPELVALGPAAQLAEIAGGARALSRVTGRDPAFFRPPHGNYEAATLSAAAQANETVALWDIDPGDWRTLTADQIVASVFKQARAPAVILFHNGKEATIEALPRIVAEFRRAGFDFVTLSELQREMAADEINDPVRVRLP